MIISEYWPLDVFSQDSYQTCEVWCRLDFACLSSVKQVISCSQRGGAMIIMEYCCLDVFRPGLLSNL